LDLAGFAIFFGSKLGQIQFLPIASKHSPTALVQDFGSESVVLETLPLKKTLPVNVITASAQISRKVESSETRRNHLGSKRFPK
jgi:hypothetical protein